MNHWGLTIKKTRKPIWLSDYQQLLNELPMVKQKIHYEDTRGLHCHLILSGTTIDYNDFKRRGWSFKIEPIYDQEGWRRYCAKDENKQIKYKHMLLELEHFEPKEVDIPKTEELIEEEENAVSCKLDIRKLKS